MRAQLTQKESLITELKNTNQKNEERLKKAQT